MKHLMIICLFVTTLLACGGDPSYHETPDFRNTKLFSTTWELYAVDDQPYDWQSFYKVYYTFTDATVELSQYDAKTKETKFKTVGKWKWLSHEKLYLDFRLPNGNGNQYNWTLTKLERDGIIYTGDDEKSYWLVPKK